MEARIADMEAEICTLQNKVAALAPMLVENVLRELTARGALLVIKSPTNGLQEMVERSVELALEENTLVENTMTKSQDGKQDDELAVVEVEVEEEEEEDEGRAEEGQRMEVVTSQESSVSANSSSGGGGDGGDASSLSLKAFEEATKCESAQVPVSSPPPPPLARIPSRPPVIVTKTLIEEASPPQRTKPTPPVVSPTANPPPPVPTVISPPTCRSELPPKPTFSVIPTKLPDDFEVQTKDSVPVAWEKWCCGDVARGFPPLRGITTKHVKAKGVARRLSDLRCVMLPIESLAQTRGLWKSSFTPNEAAAVFAALEDHLPLYAPATTDGRKRKKEIAWSTALNNMRKKRKQQTQEDSEGLDQILI